MKDKIISAQHVTAGYASKLVWKDASFEIGRGEFVAVLGPNGSGKTTLFKLMLGLMQPLSGILSVFDKRPERGNPRIGYVPQRHAVDSDMMIEAIEIVRLGLHGTRWGMSSPKQSAQERHEAEAALASVGATELAHRPLGVLSGGELQRVFLAQALVGKPDLLLLDEPLANLDIRRESELVELIQSVVTSRNVTVLLIAHNINPLLPVLNRVMYVANGHVVAGEPGEVLTSEALTQLYDSPVEVLRDSRGRIAIVGAEESGPHHDHE